LTAGDATMDRNRSDRSGSTAVPTWFGPVDRSLFGWVHVPGSPDGRGAVLCPSIGLEGEASQFAFRSLAAGLADAGCAAVRFDYDGTGDSAGELSDPDRLKAWLEGIAAAIALLREAGATQILLVGARLGAAFAVRAAETDGDVESLALWYPWTKGSQFLRYQRALRRMYAVSDDPVSADGGTEIPGFVLDAAVTADLRDLDGTASGPDVPSTVLIIDAADPGSGAVLRAGGGPVHAVRRPGTGADELFGVELMRAAVSRQDIDWIIESILSTPTPPPSTGIRPTIRPSAEIAVPGGGTVIERPVFFGTRRLFGILTDHVDAHGRDGATAAGGPAGPRLARIRAVGGPVPRFGSAIFLNAGSLHHVGPGREWVELSRRWAAAGVRCLRMDLGGVGESPLVGPPGELSSYPPTGLDDVAEGVHLMAPEDPREVVLLGLCSGAYHSLLAAPSTHVGGVAVLNPLRLPSALVQEPGSMGDLIAGAPLGNWSGGSDEPKGETRPKRRFLGSLRDSGALKPISRHIPDRVWWLANTLSHASRPVDALQRVVGSGASLFVVVGPDEWPGIGRGRKHELRRVARRGVFSLALVPNLDHNFHVASGRTEALQVLDEWVLGTGPSGRTTPSGVTFIG